MFYGNIMTKICLDKNKFSDNKKLKMTKIEQEPERQKTM